jgi:hypothetical protein
VVEKEGTALKAATFLDNYMLGSIADVAGFDAVGSQDD